MHRSGVSAVLLAAGGGSRFGGGKLLAPYKGRPLIEAARYALRSPMLRVLILLADVLSGRFAAELIQLKRLKKEAR